MIIAVETMPERIEMARRVGSHRSHAACRPLLYARTDRGSSRALRQPAGRRAQSRHNPLRSGPDQLLGFTTKRGARGSMIFLAKMELAQ
jgi:hypothetical protein